MWKTLEIGHRTFVQTGCANDLNSAGVGSVVLPVSAGDTRTRGERSTKCNGILKTHRYLKYIIYTRTDADGEPRGRWRSCCCCWACAARHGAHGAHRRPNECFVRAAQDRGCAVRHVGDVVNARQRRNLAVVVDAGSQRLCRDKRWRWHACKQHKRRRKQQRPTWHEKQVLVFFSKFCNG